ncbi:MAG TPA: hypothetical protein VIZ69_01155 [Thermoanaerobaculia bacterium]
MKKKLGGLLLTLGALVISAACATSGASSRTKEPQPEAEPGANWAKATHPVQPARAAVVPAASFARPAR